MQMHAARCAREEKDLISILNAEKYFHTQSTEQTNSFQRNRVQQQQQQLMI
jgi:hypothetical protein